MIVGSLSCLVATNSPVQCNRNCIENNEEKTDVSPQR